MENVPATQIATQQVPGSMLGSKTAVVTGTYFGQHVDTTFVQGGCQLARWAKIGQIFN